MRAAGFGSTGGSMSIYEFMAGSPFLTFFLAAVAVHLIEVIYRMPFRALNIRKHGWPPPHCDADGDLRKAEEPDAD